MSGADRERCGLPAVKRRHGADFYSLQRGPLYAGLAADCAIERTFLVCYLNDEGLDGLDDHTGADWFTLRKNSDLAKAVRLYAEVDTYRKAREAHSVNPKHTEDHTLEKSSGKSSILPGEEVLYFHEILIRTEKEWGVNALLTQIKPFVTAQFHYD